jgi:hypothetical protein
MQDGYSYQLQLMVFLISIIVSMKISLAFAFSFIWAHTFALIQEDQEVVSVFCSPDKMDIDFYKWHYAVMLFFYLAKANSDYVCKLH